MGTQSFFAASRNSKHRATRHGEQGFTLIEILVVITIIGLIMGLVGPRVLNYLSEAKGKAAKIQIESFASALDLYFLDSGRYPTTSEGLTVLVQRPGNALPWNGPYLKVIVKNVIRCAMKSCTHSTGFPVFQLARTGSSFGLNLFCTCW